MELASWDTSGTWGFEVAPGFLENLCTPPCLSETKTSLPQQVKAFLYNKLQYLSYLHPVYLLIVNFNVLLTVHLSNM